MTGLSTAGYLGGKLYNTWGGSIAFLQVGLVDLAYTLIFVLLNLLINVYYDKTAGEWRSTHRRQGGHNLALCIAFCWHDHAYSDSISVTQMIRDNVESLMICLSGVVASE